MEFPALTFRFSDAPKMTIFGETGRCKNSKTFKNSSKITHFFRNSYGLKTQKLTKTSHFGRETLRYWRFHSIHHGDRNLSTLSGVRFHPIEISLSLVYKYLLLIILSPSIEYYLLYEIILTSMALFNHSNINLNFDKTLSKIIVTPKFHFIHHDQRSFMTNSNYGNFLSIWDRLFSTFENGAIKNLGTPQVSEKQSTSIKYNLISPFIKSETKHESA